MIDTLFHIANDFFFFCIILSGIYLFIFALIALFRHSGKYPATEKKYRFVNPEKRNVPLYKNDAFQKVQKRRVPEKR